MEMAVKLIDDDALVAFAPAGLRAAFLYARMIEHLAQSVEEIVQAAPPTSSSKKVLSGCHSAFAGHLALHPSCIVSISTCYRQYAATIWSPARGCSARWT